MTDSDLVEKLDRWYRSAVDVNSEWLDRAKEAYRFYTGIEQWDPEVLAILEKDGRPALTINHIFPVINMLSGHQRQNRSDIRLYPRRGGTSAVAALGTELLKHTMETCSGNFALSDVFLDGVISGKGWLSAERVFDDDPVQGDLVVRKDSPFDVVADQGNRDYDLNKGRYVFRRYWWNKREVELKYPGKASELSAATQDPQWGQDQFHPADDFANLDDYSSESEYLNADAAGEREETKYLIRDCWYKEWENCVFLVHLPTLTVRRIEKADAKKAKMVMNLSVASDFKIIERPGPVLHRVVAIGNLVLEHEKDPLRGLTLFPLFRFCPYWVDGYVMGVVDNLIDPQREHNKNRSQALHNMNQTANSGWMVNGLPADGGKELKQSGSKPGFIIDRSKYGGQVEKIQPNPLDRGHLDLGQQSALDIRKISGVNEDLTGTNPSHSESGRARLIRQSAGMMLSEVVFDNFRRTQRSVGEFLWEMIRATDVYSEEEILAVCQENQIKEFVQTDPETGEGRIDLSPMRNWNTGRYGVQVSESQSLPTVRMAHFEQALNAVKAGVPIPPEVLIELGDFPNKDEIIAGLKQQQQQAALPAGAQ